MCLQKSFRSIVIVVFALSLVACKLSVLAKEFSQHRHRSFRLVIASLQVCLQNSLVAKEFTQDEQQQQRREQRLHLEPTLRTTPAHTQTGFGRTDKEKLRGASRRHHKRQTRGVCLCIRPGLTSCARWLLAKKFVFKRVFAASSS